MSEGLNSGKFGPRTREGLARCTLASWKHGQRSQAAKQEARAFRQFLRECKATIAEVSSPKGPQTISEMQAAKPVRSIPVYRNQADPQKKFMCYNNQCRG